jgi:hypothetical protein
MKAPELFDLKMLREKLCDFFINGYISNFIE